MWQMEQESQLIEDMKEKVNFVLDNENTSVISLLNRNSIKADVTFQSNCPPLHSPLGKIQMNKRDQKGDLATRLSSKAAFDCQDMLGDPPFWVS